MLRVAIAASLLLLSARTFSATDEDRAALRQFLEHTIASTASFDDRFDAEVWLVDMQARLAAFIESPNQRLQLLRQVHQAATSSGITPELVLALIEVESTFDRFAVSRAGAQGYRGPQDDRLHGDDPLTLLQGEQA